MVTNRSQQRPPQYPQLEAKNPTRQLSPIFQRTRQQQGYCRSNDLLELIRQSERAGYRMLQKIKNERAGGTNLQDPLLQEDGRVGERECGGVVAASAEVQGGKRLED